MSELLSVNDIKNMFYLDNKTGNLFWSKDIKRPRVKPGMLAGTIDSKGRRRIQIAGKTYAAHHIVYAIFYGVLPADQVDHINGDKLDNLPSNLRLASNAENSRNRAHKKTQSGFKGVNFHKKQRKFCARIMKDGVCFYLGSFDDPQIAAHEYNKAAIALHGEFASLNPIGEDYDLSR